MNLRKVVSNYFLGTDISDFYKGYINFSREWGKGFDEIESLKYVKRLYLSGCAYSPDIFSIVGLGGTLLSGEFEFFLSITLLSESSRGLLRSQFKKQRKISEKYKRSCIDYEKAIQKNLDKGSRT